MNPDRRDIRTICPNCFATLDRSGFCFGCRQRASSATKPNALPPLTLLKERYLVGRPLGMGGFGITYLGWDRHYSVKVAIKEFFPKDYTARIAGSEKVNVLNESFIGPFKHWQASFIQEAQILTTIQNVAGVVKIIDFFQANNTAYIVMEYLEGKSLRDHLFKRGGRIPIEETLLIMRPVLDALLALHQFGIIHKDISPDNIQLIHGRYVKLIDFGSAGFYRNNEQKPYVVLKKGFSPIELYSTKSNQGPWSDVYSVGATIYNCLTGAIPPEATQRFKQDTLLKPSAFGIRIPIARENSLMKALQVLPENRYNNIGEFTQMLYGELFTVPRL